MRGDEHDALGSRRRNAREQERCQGEEPGHFGAQCQHPNESTRLRCVVDGGRVAGSVDRFGMPSGDLEAQLRCRDAPGRILHAKHALSVVGARSAVGLGMQPAPRVAIPAAAPGFEEYAMRRHPFSRLTKESFLVSAASHMRSEPTRAEWLLWREIRGARLGVVFRRQVPLGGHYVADFVALSAKLVVELDGGYHQRRAVKDARRDAALQRLGYRVLRIPNEAVERERLDVLSRIRAALVRKA